MTPFVSYYTSLGQPPSRLVGDSPGNKDEVSGRPQSKMIIFELSFKNNCGLSNKQSTYFPFLFFPLSSTQVEIIVAFRLTIHNW